MIINMIIGKLYEIQVIESFEKVVDGLIVQDGIKQINAIDFLLGRVEI